ncbi:alpha-N-arabinofuranosidase [Mucilaginibacter gracilis]|uniref:Alpha-N-arabinofuranosidase n=2 Tax=Mucilaginibacter gracilis TaxID=423350 RepID=A0A495J109_9SPHI|nr:alpha-N-arabinofuranosidase [Mucilaginibacter gracilis]
MILLLGCLFRNAAAQPIHLVNPILSGFYPDPSIVKVGADYYLVNSTFSYFPGLPLFHSKDLKNWEQLANIISRKSQMDFIGERMTRGLFAPGISYYKGTFYVTCTNIDNKGNFVVTARNPAGPWSDPVWLPKVRGIDPSIFFDGGKAYVVYNSDPPDYKPLYQGHRTIKMFEFDIENLTTIGEEKIVVNGGVDISKKPVWIEGPHLLKRNDWYYLYAAEGGTSVNHSEVVFRSKSVWGPYLPYEKNPILTQRDLPEDRKYPVTSTGHAQLVEGPDRKTYAVFLGVRPYTGDYYNTGRETFIAPVQWENDWPVINAGNAEVKYDYLADYKEVKLKNSIPQSGNFGYTLNFNSVLDPSLVFLRSCDSSSFSVNKTSGLWLKLKPETCMGYGNPSFIGKRQQHLLCTAETELTFIPEKENEKAGLVIFQDEKHFYFIGKSVSGGKHVLQLFKSTGDGQTMELLAEAPVAKEGQAVGLRIAAEGEYYSCSYASEPGHWVLLKDKLDGKFLSTHEAGGFIGCFFGLYATSSGMTSHNSASFKYLRYDGTDEVYKKQNTK